MLGLKRGAIRYGRRLTGASFQKGRIHLLAEAVLMRGGRSLPKESFERSDRICCVLLFRLLETFAWTTACSALGCSERQRRPTRRQGPESLWKWHREAQTQTSGLQERCKWLTVTTETIDCQSAGCAADQDLHVAVSHARSSIGRHTAGFYEQWLTLRYP